jgi:hypothetical protein
MKLYITPSKYTMTIYEITCVTRMCCSQNRITIDGRSEQLVCMKNNQIIFMEIIHLLCVIHSFTDLKHISGSLCHRMTTCIQDRKQEGRIVAKLSK